jgi:indole-3-acetate monooxygenase
MTTTIRSDSAALIETARSFGPRIWAMRDEIEENRRLPMSLVQDLTDAGYFRMLAPRALGGLEVDPITAMHVVEAFASVDGSAGWAVMVGNAGFLTAYLANEGVQELLASGSDLRLAGALIPAGKADVVDGGYRVSGRWTFASGIEYCTWAVGACMVYEDGQQQFGPNGAPRVQVMFFPAGSFEVIDTWSVGGLRGTGSHDFAVAGQFVPAQRSFALTDAPVQPGPLFHSRGLISAAMAAVPLGIARGAIEALVALAGTKTPTGGRTLLRERGMVQMHVARAEATLRAARALLIETMRDAWGSVVEGDKVGLEQQASLRLAAVHAAAGAKQVVDLMHEAGGGASIYTGNPLERALRDVHTATQHFTIQPSNYELVGRVLLGMPPGGPLSI